MSHDGWLWTIFAGLVVVMMALDFGRSRRRNREMHFREAAAWSGVWIALAMAYAGVISYFRDGAASMEFVTGYLIEESLSVDNLFVFLAIFSYFAVPAIHQHGVLFWGIIGAMILRAIFIVTGVALLHAFHWIIYVFGAILVISGLKLGFSENKEPHPEKNLVLRLFRRFMPVTKDYEGHHFIVRREGRRWATPLLMVLIVVETTDLLFAVDSIPAVLAITSDKLIVYTSNIFAIMGLRALYFTLKGALNKFHLLHYSLGAILIFVGVKMLLSEHVKIPTGIALGVVGGILMLSVVASLLWPPRSTHRPNL